MARCAKPGRSPEDARGLAAPQRSAGSAATTSPERLPCPHLPHAEMSLKTYTMGSRVKYQLAFSLFIEL